jgi:hypothetical protein
MGTRCFAYRALDASGRETTGQVQADTAAGAREQVRRQGLRPVAVEQGPEPPPQVVPDARPPAIEERARRNVHLPLLNALAEGAEELTFSFGNISVELACLIDGRRRRLLPLSGDLSDAILAELRRMSGQPALGTATVSARRSVELVAGPAHEAGTHRVTLVFHSSADVPRRVGVRIIQPRAPSRQPDQDQTPPGA